MVKQKIKLSSRLAAFLLAVLMMASLFPAAAFADGPEDTPVPAGQTDSQPAVVEQDETTTPDDTTPQPGEPPAPEPAQQPTAEPTTELTTEPTAEPTAEPTTEPTTEPTAEPTAEPTTEPTAEPTTEPEPETPAEVKAFLDAVAAIVVPEEDLTLPENAELAETYSGEVFAAYALYEQLTEEQQALEAVAVSLMELENMVMVLPDYAASTYALSYINVNPGYNPGQCYPGVSKFGGSVSKTVGESGFYKRRAVHNFYCPNCGWFFGQSTAKEYANIQCDQSTAGVIKDVSFQAGSLDGYPCLEMDFTGAKAGTTLVTLQYDVNFHTRWNSGYAACPSCGMMTTVDQYDDRWYHYTDTFYVTVTGSETAANATHYFFVPADYEKNGSLKFELTNVELYQDGFLWCSVGNSGSQPQITYENGADQYVTVDTLNGVSNGYYRYYTGYNLEIKGSLATPENTPVTVKVRYYDSDSYCKQWKTATLKIVVYEPETITLKVGDTEKFTYRSDVSNDTDPNGYLESCKPKSNNGVISANDDSYGNAIVIKGLKAGSDSAIADYGYYRYRDGSNYAYIDTWYLDVVNVKVVDTLPATTPVTIVKTFDGLTEDQIPENFSLKYTVSGCQQHSNVTGTLNSEDATLTNPDGVPALTWDVDLPVAEHGTDSHLITFTEDNAAVAGYETPTFSGNRVWLEDLEVENGAKRPVITLTNSYEPNKTMYVLSYDGMGGTGCPATQYVNIGSTTAHTFDVAGTENPVKIPTHPQGYVFLGWAETDTNQVLAYRYNSTSKTYSPAAIILTSTAPSKTLYAVWEQRPHTEPNPSLEKLEKVRVTDESEVANAPDDVEYGAVVFKSDTQKVKLLYKITVTGTAGAAYKVTDEGAEWVSGGSNHETKDGVLTITGTIAEGETTAVIYVTKTFTANNIQNNTLTNTANLVSNDPITDENPDGTENPEPGKETGSGSAEAGESRNVTINFKTDAGDTLDDSISKDYTKGGAFEGITVNKPSTARRVTPRADTTTLVIPWTIKKGNLTYVLNEVLSKDALERLNALQTVDADVAADLIYSLDMQGNATDQNGNPIDGPDGIPDIYQIKVTYKVENGAWDDGKTAEKFAYYTRLDETGTMSSEPTDTAELTNIPAVGGKPAPGFKAGTWNTTPTAGSKITEDSTYTYTYTKIQVTVKATDKGETGTGIWTVGGGSNDKTLTPEENEDVVTIPEITPPAGKEFAGWVDDKGKNVQPDANGQIPVTDDMTIYPVWTDLEYEVTFNFNYPVSDKAEVEIAPFIHYNDLLGNWIPTVKDQPGYVFKGWQLAAGTTGVDWKGENGKDTLVTKDFTVEGTWAKLHTVTFDPDGGTPTPASQQVEDNTALGEKMPDNPTREGYTFSGWVIKNADGTETPFTRDTKVTGDITVVAQWTANPTQTPNPSPSPSPNPTPNPNPNPTPGPVNPTPAPTAAPEPPAAEPAAVPVAPAPVVPAAPAAPVEEDLPEPVTPEAGPAATPAPTATPEPVLESLDDEQAPLAGPGNGAWALVNLILMVLTILASILLLLGFAGKKQKELRDENGNRVLNANGEQQYEWTKKRHGGVRLFSLVPALGALIAFILTENIRLPMVLVDRWTLLMALIALVQVAVCLFAKKQKDEHDGETPSGPAPARA